MEPESPLLRRARRTADVARRAPAATRGAPGAARPPIFRSPSIPRPLGVATAPREGSARAGHADRRTYRFRRTVAVGALATVFLLAVVTVTSLLSGASGDGPGDAVADIAPAVVALPVPAVTSAGVDAAEDPGSATDSVAPAVPASGICDDADLTAAVAAGDDSAAIAAAGGGDAFRRAVAEGRAPCIDLADPARIWMVVNKLRPSVPLDYAPATLVRADGVQRVGQGIMRADAAAALSAMVAAARAAGAGDIGIQNGYRSYGLQQSIYSAQVSQRGGNGADLVSARPGFSEHQSGLSADVVACRSTCGELDDLAGTAQNDWIVAHAAEFGWVIRYEEGFTAISGYTHEPWHLRYIGVDLAAAYRDGGFHTLEEFFGLPAAPDYAD